jgi:ABC-type polysaccharide/polyol phosphate export permease
VRDLRLRYKQAAMGFGWAILMPALIIVSGLVVRVAMARHAGIGLAAGEVGGLAVKALGWSFFVGAITFATQSLVANLTLITKVYFAREVLPLAAVLAQCVDAAVGGVVVTALLLVIGIRPDAAWLWAPGVAALLVGLTAAVALALSCANLFFRDVKYLVQVGVTFGIFFTPVLFEAATFGPIGVRLVMLNPLAPLLEGLRLSLVEGHNLLRPIVVATTQGESVLAWSPWYLAYAAAWVVVGLPLATLVFHKLEYVFAERV